MQKKLGIYSSERATTFDVLQMEINRKMNMAHDYNKIVLKGKSSAVPEDSIRSYYSRFAKTTKDARAKSVPRVMGETATTDSDFRKLNLHFLKKRGSVETRNQSFGQSRFQQSLPTVTSNFRSVIERKSK